MIYSNLSISVDNNKLGVIPSISLPAGITCRKNAPCFGRGCYGQKGTYNYENVKASLMNNYTQYQQDAAAYFSTIVDFLSGGVVIYKYFRWHCVGDIPTMDYFRGMVDVAKKCKYTRFLCFTKQFEIVNEYVANGGKIPANLRIVFSAWDRSFIVPNPYHFPIAYVQFCKKRASETPAIPAHAMECKGNCEGCLGCWSLGKDGAVKFKQH